MPERVNVGDNGTAPGRRVHFTCPGCDDFHTVTVEAPNGWDWNGDLERPTFAPSVLVRYGIVAGEDRRCHSFVRDGRVEFLSDCTHEFAGQTVDLPPWGGFPWDHEETS